MTDAATVLATSWALSPSVALRPESFGALAYHFGNRRLTFLKTPELVAVLHSLGHHADARAALVAAGVPGDQHETYGRVLSGLEAADVIRRRTGQEPT